MIIPTISTYLYQVTRFKDQLLAAQARRRAALLLSAIVAVVTIGVIAWILR